MGATRLRVPLLLALLLGQVKRLPQISIMHVPYIYPAFDSLFTLEYTNQSTDVENRDIIDACDPERAPRLTRICRQTQSGVRISAWHPDFSHYTESTRSFPRFLKDLLNASIHAMVEYLHMNCSDWNSEVSSFDDLAYAKPWAHTASLLEPGVAWRCLTRSSQRTNHGRRLDRLLL